MKYICLVALVFCATLASSFYEPYTGLNYFCLKKCEVLAETNEETSYCETNSYTGCKLRKLHI